MRNMPTEGMIVAPFYHDIKAIGAEGRALRCEGYMEYFKNRVLAGLGASEVALGYSGSASRSAADTIERGMYNTVREFQKVISGALETEIFRELALEGGYEWNNADKVEFFFPEIDIDDKIKDENHIINLYAGNLITESEARGLMGRQPVSDEDRSELYFNLVEMPRALIGAVDEPYLSTYGAPALKMALRTAGGGRMNLVKSLDMPRNQYGTKMAPGTTKDVEDDITLNATRLLSRLNSEEYGSGLSNYYRVAATDARNMIQSRYIDGVADTVESLSDYNGGTLDLIMGLTMEEMIKYSGTYITHALTSGINDACIQAGVTDVSVEYSHPLDYLYGKNREWLSRVFNTIRDSSVGIIRKAALKVDAIDSMQAVFESNEFRITLGARNEVQRAYNIGIFTGGLAFGYSKFSITNTDYDEEGKCSLHSGVTHDISMTFDLDVIPPGYMTHPLCTCTIELIR